MSSVRSRVLMVGLPQSGKTTFLAALWHIVQEVGVSSALRFRKLQGDSAYLNRIRQAWLSCKQLERTTIQNEQVVTLWLHNQAGEEIELTIPDLSGEAFELQLRERRWSTEFDALVNNTNGVLLFVHPDAIRAGRRIDFAQKLQSQLRPSGGAQPTMQSSAQAIPVPWSHDQMPTQVQLVELIQFVAERCKSRDRLRVAVIISAWDLVESIVADPEEVVRKQMPLLWQFLYANTDSISHIVVGVSAQGGDIEKDCKALLEKDAPSLRINVVGLDSDAHDLSAPVSWLIE